MILLYFFSFHFKYYFTFFCCSAYDFIYNIIFLCCCCCCCERRALNWAVLQSKNLIVFELILSFLLTFWLTFWEWISIKQFFCCVVSARKNIFKWGRMFVGSFSLFYSFCSAMLWRNVFFSLLLFLLLFFSWGFSFIFFSERILKLIYYIWRKISLCETLIRRDFFCTLVCEGEQRIL